MQAKVPSEQIAKSKLYGALVSDDVRAVIALLRLLCLSAHGN